MSQWYERLIIFLMVLSAYLYYLMLDTYPAVRIFMETDLALFQGWWSSLMQFLKTAFLILLLQTRTVQASFLLLVAFGLYYLLWSFRSLRNKIFKKIN